MSSNTILNWDNINYKELYARQLKENPLYWSDDLNAWIVYSHEFCKNILLNNNVHVPEPVIEGSSLLNDKARLAIRKLARLSNNKQHCDSRQAALLLYQGMGPVSTAELLRNLLSWANNTREFDWVAVVCKKLPVLVILKGLGFNDDDCAFVTDHIMFLVKIMSPNKTENDIKAINGVINEFYAISERYIKSARFAGCILTGINSGGKIETTELFVSNLIGLFIQSYGAGRGLLTNALLNLANYHPNQGLCMPEVKNIIVETLRFDAPVQNTGRVAINDFFVGGQLIKAGQSVLITLAAANLDPLIFKNAEIYDTGRSNNDQHLTFGLGAHNCLAKHLTINMAAETCLFLVDNYKRVDILQQELNYEPQLNVRLVKELMIKLS